MAEFRMPDCADERMTRRALAAFWSEQRPDGATKPITVVPAGERKPAPRLAGIDLHGAQLASSDLGGKVLVVNVWGSWCAPCQISSGIT